MLGLQYESNFQQLLTLIRILESLASSDEFTILNKDDFQKAIQLLKTKESIKFLITLKKIIKTKFA